MRLTKIEDPRDNLDRASRDQLYQFARSRGVKEIDERLYMGGNAADLMRMILRQKGFTDINVPYHQLGMPPKAAMPEQSSGKPAMMMEDLLREQLKEVMQNSSDAFRRTVDNASPRPYEGGVNKSVADMSIRELRHACKVRGVKMYRTDNIARLREKLNAQPQPD